eukprot:3033997-Rhodomonas_salina.1
MDIDDIDFEPDQEDPADRLEFTNPNLASQFAKGNLILYVPSTAPKRGQDDHPLAQPPKDEDYHGINRLKELLLPDDKGNTCIRLLDGRELMRYIAEGGTMKRRQEMEASHPHLFANEQLVQILLDEMAKERKCRDTKGEDFIFFPGIVAVSYAWADPSHPDPNGDQMRQLGPATEWYLSERSRLRQRVKRELNASGYPEAKISENEAPNSVMFGVFLDYMCLHQAPFSEVEEEYYKRAQFNVGILYAHERTMVFQVAETPSENAER